jgi:Mg-chelatase subunit ChlD
MATKSSLRSVITSLVNMVTSNNSKEEQPAIAMMDEGEKKLEVIPEVSESGRTNEESSKKEPYNIFHQVTANRFNFDYVVVPSKHETTVSAFLSWKQEEVGEKEKQVILAKSVYHFIFVVDKSFSMFENITEENLTTNKIKMDLVKQCLMELLPMFLDMPNKEIRLTLISFNNKSTTLIFNQKVRVADKEGIENKIQHLNPESDTNIRKALQTTVNEVNELKKREEKEKIYEYKVFMLTDGENSNTWENDILIEEYKKSGLVENTTCVGIGSAKNYNGEFLQKFCKTLVGGITATELKEAIIGLCFEACNKKATDVKIEFPVHTKLMLPIVQTNSHVITLPTFNSFQQIPLLIKFPQIGIANSNVDTLLSVNIPLKIEYMNEMKEMVKEEVNVTFSDSKSTSFKEFDKWAIENYCQINAKYRKAYEDNDPSKVIPVLNDVVMRLQHWKVGERLNLRMKAMWTALETDVKNQLTRLTEMVKERESAENMTRMMAVGKAQCKATGRTGNLNSMSCESSSAPIRRANTSAPTVVHKVDAKKDNGLKTAQPSVTDHKSKTAQSVAKDAKDKVPDVSKSSLSSAPDKDKCILCLTNKRDMVFTPCGHFVSCEPCGRKYYEENKETKCVMCRQNITGIIKVEIPIECKNMKCILCKKDTCETVHTNCCHVCTCFTCATTLKELNRKCPVLGCDKKVTKFYVIYQ